MTIGENYGRNISPSAQTFRDCREAQSYKSLQNYEEEARLLDQTKIVNIQDSCEEFRMLRFEERSCVRRGENRIGKIKQSTRSPRDIVPRRINKPRWLCWMFAQ